MRNIIISICELASSLSTEYSSSTEVLDLLRQRYLLPNPPNMTARYIYIYIYIYSELNNFSVIQQKKIQIKSFEHYEELGG